MKDELGDRIKSNYEDRTRIKLPRRSYTIVRLDGRSFHTYAKNLKRPFDDGLIEDMDATAMYLCKNIMGAKFAFVQSDEISILLTDFEDHGTQAWFDNNLQKMCSVSASMATSKFNQLRLKRNIELMLNYSIKIIADKDENVYERARQYIDNFKLAEFDSRVFQVPQKAEVENTMIWRQQDCTRNSIQLVAQSLYSQKELHGKHSDQLQEMIFQKGINWNDYAPKYKRGRIIVKETYEKEIDESIEKSKSSIRTRWVSQEPPIFTQERDFLQSLIPNNI